MYTGSLGHPLCHDECFYGSATHGSELHTRGYLLLVQFQLFPANDAIGNLPVSRCLSAIHQRFSPRLDVLLLLLLAHVAQFLTTGESALRSSCRSTRSTVAHQRQIALPGAHRRRRRVTSGRKRFCCGGDGLHRRVRVAARRISICIRVRRRRVAVVRVRRTVGRLCGRPKNLLQLILESLLLLYLVLWFAFCCWLLLGHRLLQRCALLWLLWLLLLRE
mmetsp:Transcript_8591/g.26670  ORF Transcript_8591/g.26670 Transcript_8591/m.26670 type:complete len:219 (+) Transcript_8591:944-1600(+)